MKRLFVTYANHDFDGYAHSIAMSTMEVHSEIYNCNIKTEIHRATLVDPRGAEIRFDIYFGNEDLEVLDIHAKGDSDLLKEHEKELKRKYRMIGFNVRKITEMH